MRLQEEQRRTEAPLRDLFLRHHDVTPPYLTCPAGANGQALRARVLSTTSAYPVSIRDQMLRSTLLVEHCIAERLVSLTPLRSLLVVGAGAAGVAAYMYAIERGVPAELLEARKHPFLLQGHSSRWIDPTQYDWPARHWPSAQFPVTRRIQVPLPLPWKAAPAAELRQRWVERLDDFVKKGFPLWKHRPQYETRVVRFDVRPLGAAGDTLLDVYVHLQEQFNPYESEAPKPHPRFECEHPRCKRSEAGVVLLCLGLGPEETSVGQYRSPKFWSTPLPKTTAQGIRARHPTRPLRVLISGAGDGGLQDLLHLVTGQRSVRDVYKRLRQSHPSAKRALQSIERHIQCAEDQASRAYQWSSPAQDHELFEWSQATYCWAIRRLKQTPGWPFIQETLDELAQEGGLTPLQLDLSFRCTHFGFCYAFNRFLTLMFAKHFTDANPHARVRLLPCRSTASVSPDSDQGHSCGKWVSLEDSADFSECYGKESHLVRFTRKACHQKVDCGQQASGSVALEERYDLVIIRHGIQREKKERQLLDILPNIRARLLLQYYFTPSGLEPHL